MNIRISSLNNRKKHYKIVYLFGAKIIYNLMKYNILEINEISHSIFILSFQFINIIMFCV